jgi:MGT family glycosyltransferase
MARVVIAISPIYGHVAPLRMIAEDLVRRGNSVTVLTGSRFREFVEATGATFVPLSGYADFDNRRIEEWLPDRPAEAGPDQLNFDFQHVFIDAMPDQHHSLQRVLAEAGDEPVVVLHDQSFLGSVPVLLGAAGIRPAAVIGIGMIPLQVSSIDTAPPGLGLPPDSSPAGRERNRAANAAVQGELFGASQAYFVDALHALGITKEPPFVLDGLVTLPDQFLQLTVPSMEYPRSDAPATLRYVGALPSVIHDSVELPSWWPEVLQADRVVVVSQGTLATTDLSELVEPSLRALADLDALVVATTGRAADLKNVPTNARVADFVPFDRLLPHADLLISNGGYGGVQQALTYGVPLVLAGVSEDKIEVTARTAWTGAAINLATQRPAVDQIRSAAREVLDTPSYRENANRLREEYGWFDPLDAIAKTIDEVLASDH